MHQSGDRADQTEQRRDGHDRAGEQRPHKKPALDEKAHDCLHRSRRLGDYGNSAHQLAYIVNDISSSKPSGGSELATSSGIGGNCISRTDCRHTFAKDSLEVFSTILRFVTRPLRSTEKTRRSVPMLTKSPCLAT